ncbi:MAG: hypothetical protein IT169_19510 [Bryobacterales bacterium]|nr:hypothetical protein [Bryobacterales bacterium]
MAVSGLQSGWRPPSVMGERVVAGSVTLFLLAQMLLLARAGALPSKYEVEVWVVAFTLALLGAQAWLVRRYLPPHADMLLLMLAWGGFGMLWGWQLDGGLAAMQSHGAPHAMHSDAMHGDAMHSDAMHSDAMHGGAMGGTHAGGMHASGHRGVSAMNALMLLFAFPPSLAWARCLAAYRAFPLRLAWVLALDALGMILGMMAGGRALGPSLGVLLSAPAFAHHLAMLIGMLAGMAVTMALRPWLAPLPSSTR